MTVKIIDVEVYNHTLVRVFYDEPISRVKKFLDSVADSEMEEVGSKEAFVYRYRIKDDPHFILWLPKKTQAKTLAHECFHLTNFILARADVSYDSENDEPYAYLLGFLFEKIEKLLSKKK